MRVSRLFAGANLIKKTQKSQNIAQTLSARLDMQIVFCTFALINNITS